MIISRERVKAGIFVSNDDDLFLRGHFEDNPIVPMTTMAAVMAKYAFLEHQEGIHVVNAFSVSSREPVRPGDQIAITVERKDKRENFGGIPAISGKYVCKRTDVGQTVAEMSLDGMVLEPHDGLVPIRRPLTNIGGAKYFADAEQVQKILPHRDTMLFISNLLEWDEIGVGAMFQPTDDFPFTEEWPGSDVRVIPIFALAEAMGQAGIAYLAHKHWPGKPVQTLATGLSMRQFLPIVTGDRVILNLALKRDLKPMRGTYFGKGVATAYLPATGQVAAIMECMASITPAA